MTFTTGELTSPVDGTVLATYAWTEVADPRGVVQVAHGLAEHSARYDRLARALNAAGYVVHAADHRGPREVDRRACPATSATPGSTG